MMNMKKLVDKLREHNTLSKEEFRKIMISKKKFKTLQSKKSRLLQNIITDLSIKVANMKFQRKLLINTADYLKLYKITKIKMNVCILSKNQ